MKTFVFFIAVSQIFSFKAFYVSYTLNVFKKGMPLQAPRQFFSTGNNRLSSLDFQESCRSKYVDLLAWISLMKRNVPAHNYSGLE